MVMVKLVGDLYRGQQNVCVTRELQKVQEQVESEVNALAAIRAERIREGTSSDVTRLL